jgi:hypothetical protein
MNLFPANSVPSQCISLPSLVGLKRARDAFPLEASHCHRHHHHHHDKENASSASNKSSLSFILSTEQPTTRPVPRLPSLSSLSLAKTASSPAQPWGTPQKLATAIQEPALHPQAKFARRHPALVAPAPLTPSAAAVPVKKGSKYCMVEGCMSRAKHARRCWRHGGSIKCKVPDCSNRAKTKGVCWSHGGGTTCAFDGCSTISVSNGVCWAHGGGKRCAMEGCARPAYERTDHLCTLHFEEKQYISRLRAMDAAPVAPLPAGFSLRSVASLHDRL